MRIIQFLLFITLLCNICLVSFTGNPSPSGNYELMVARYGKIEPKKLNVASLSHDIIFQEGKEIFSYAVSLTYWRYLYSKKYIDILANVGISYGFLKSEGNFFIPFGGSVLMGKRRLKFEVGLQNSLAFYTPSISETIDGEPIYGSTKLKLISSPYIGSRFVSRSLHYFIGVNPVGIYYSKRDSGIGYFSKFTYGIGLRF